MKFKIVLFIIISLFLVIIGSFIFLAAQNPKNAVINSKEVSFNSAVTFQINESVKFIDGLSVTLLGINDSRCKPGVVCVWAGELSPMFVLVSGNIGETQKEIRLGDSTAKQLIQNNYIFLLNSATENTATITVTNENNQSPSNPNACYIGGCSSQICSDKENAVSTCEYKSEYACYKNAECKRQSNGQCRWTQTAELKTCLGGKNF